ncbi:hypothetical protein EC973_004479 [Apophysomyces ossiformis]|uniref:Uncharacterized protein n=1 Tax=Apophysomyces ossiformis TaxID=679940 RepID=A0A8H7EKJ1_9FUNG|nr:hypothetical protein EC973_004479 [Apophysomyces ossiformis]
MGTRPVNNPPYVNSSDAPSDIENILFANHEGTCETDREDSIEPAEQLQDVEEEEDWIADNASSIVRSNLFTQVQLAISSLQNGAASEQSNNNSWRKNKKHKVFADTLIDIVECNSETRLKLEEMKQRRSAEEIEAYKLEAEARRVEAEAC